MVIPFCCGKMKRDTGFLKSILILKILLILREQRKINSQHKKLSKYSFLRISQKKNCGMKANITNSMNITQQ